MNGGYAGRGSARRLVPNEIPSLQELILLALFVCTGFTLLPLLPRWFRSRHRACPECDHNVEGLPAPRCVECGACLEAGVVPRGGIGRGAGRRLAAGWIVFGVVAGALSIIVLRTQWTPLLARAGVLQIQDLEVHTTSMLLLDGNHRIDIARKLPLGCQGEREVEVDIYRTAQLAGLPGAPVCTWSATAAAADRRGSDVPGFRFQSDAMIRSFRRQLPRRDRDPLAAVLHDEHDSMVLRDMLVAAAGPVVAPDSRGWLLGHGGELLDGRIIHRRGQDIRFLNHRAWWSPVPLSGLILLVTTLCFACPLLRMRSRLVPWKPDGPGS